MQRPRIMLVANGKIVRLRQLFVKIHSEYDVGSARHPNGFIELFSPRKEARVHYLLWYNRQGVEVRFEAHTLNVRTRSMGIAKGHIKTYLRVELEGRYMEPHEYSPVG